MACIMAARSSYGGDLDRVSPGHQEPSRNVLPSYGRQRGSHRQVDAENTDQEDGPQRTGHLAGGDEQTTPAEAHQEDSNADETGAVDSCTHSSSQTRRWLTPALAGKVA